ncbi:MAG TPA: fumarylacetoacetate hydrolase family protein [Pseudonocardiaceae bacterium]|nr:fumarylacetoacetate hydrolase family protein [Pseudonocardiaceae bacterium]
MPGSNLITDRDTAATTAVVRLMHAASAGEPCAPVRDLLGTDIDLAYTVQKRQTASRIAAGATVVGHKIGLTSPAVQWQLGVDQPDFGVLFDDMSVSVEFPAARLVQPKAEAEIAFVLSADLDDPGLTIADVRSAVGYATPALEIVDSRIREWDITITDTIADNASSGLFVLGDEQAELSRFEPRTATMALEVDGEPASRGTGADCLGDPLAALLWLARTAHAHGDPLRAGQIVLSGALGPMVAVRPGSTIHAQISGLGGVTVSCT